ncbi:hypothetical protein TetV_355 [Tetraselmis virus 1]|uniref:Uncharacterized protein n=1 Tax=Tetraselmis virus 1 TaxID=2060617 RepID=A0A2P0VNG8_9VIRU|nr:hypothetical protein QJ968_gp355 [Tetraselmis virus 1]AUF82447.1 hypothetical protein TetV_355 [Tetraselmis virus 1]
MRRPKRSSKSNIQSEANTSNSFINFFNVLPAQLQTSISKGSILKYVTKSLSFRDTTTVVNVRHILKNKSLFEWCTRKKYMKFDLFEHILSNLNTQTISFFEELHLSDIFSTNKKKKITSFVFKESIKADKEAVFMTWLSFYDKYYKNDTSSLIEQIYTHNSVNIFCQLVSWFRKNNCIYHLVYNIPCINNYDILRKLLQWFGNRIIQIPIDIFSRFLNKSSNILLPIGLIRMNKAQWTKKSIYQIVSNPNYSLQDILRFRTMNGPMEHILHACYSLNKMDLFAYFIDRGYQPCKIFCKESIKDLVLFRKLFMTSRCYPIDVFESCVMNLTLSDELKEIVNCIIPRLPKDTRIVDILSRSPHGEFLLHKMIFKYPFQKELFQHKHYNEYLKNNPSLFLFQYFITNHLWKYDLAYVLECCIPKLYTDKTIDLVYYIFSSFFNKTRSDIFLKQEDNILRFILQRNHTNVSRYSHLFCYLREAVDRARDTLYKLNTVKEIRDFADLYIPLHFSKKKTKESLRQIVSGHLDLITVMNDDKESLLIKNPYLFVFSYGISKQQKYLELITHSYSNCSTDAEKDMILYKLVTFVPSDTNISIFQERLDNPEYLKKIRSIFMFISGTQITSNHYKLIDILVSHKIVPDRYFFINCLSVQTEQTCLRLIDYLDSIGFDWSQIHYTDVIGTNHFGVIKTLMSKLGWTPEVVMRCYSSVVWNQEYIERIEYLLSMSNSNEIQQYFTQGYLYVLQVIKPEYMQYTFFRKHIYILYNLLNKLKESLSGNVCFNEGIMMRGSSAQIKQYLDNMIKKITN